MYRTAHSLIRSHHKHAAPPPSPTATPRVDKQMAEPSLPPAGRRRHATGTSAGTSFPEALEGAAKRRLDTTGRRSGADSSRTGDRSCFFFASSTIISLPGHREQCNKKKDKKTSKNVPCHRLIPTRYAFQECAKSSHGDTFFNTVCITVCLFIYLICIIALFVRELHTRKMFHRFVLPD